ncbi:hypothetical protein LOTGIDRAFT_238529 [Lottia gigantea]|uniref:Phosphatidic acid phosphatase type 2/haloperoxidase domain-containing protein n=1 Tax=Lottia gigantea TaxID=225164 RepID=V4A8Z7_LOTGI|nr:hypothetical protein LOTGIDRAFT_238529 [Lottia gigantea]ESP00414.1 hypothetical protein LOTGIDRAFT_238529 [Lottia gigantea]
MKFLGEKCVHFKCKFFKTYIHGPQRHSKTIGRHKLSQDYQRLISEVILRVILHVAFLVTDELEPFHRAIQPEELWLYRFPKTPSYYTVETLYVTVILVPVIVFGLFYLITNDFEDLVQSVLGMYLVFGLCGLITNIIKLAVGRPRPDFLQRCFPNEDMLNFNNVLNTKTDCKGTDKDVFEGLKSFPSGHSSHAMVCLGYIGFYVAGKFRVFSSKGQTSSWHLLTVVAFFLWAILIAISRTADYHHHWQDVSVGLILGLVVSSCVYFHAFPPLHHIYSHLPYSVHGHHDRIIDVETAMNSKSTSLKLV